MTQAAIFLASSFALPELEEPKGARLIGADEREALGHYGHVPPNPDQIGGTFSFSALNGTAVGEQDFKDHWTLLYFGYARCTDSCPTAIPAIAIAADQLRAAGVPARAAFVDIEASAIGTVRRRNADNEEHTGHVHELDRRMALRAMQGAFGSKIQILTGTRGQLSAASIAFRVAREHIPPREGERGHSINHSSLIYLLDPNAKVAGYGYHTTSPAALVETVQKLRKAKS